MLLMNNCQWKKTLLNKKILFIIFLLTSQQVCQSNGSKISLPNKNQRPLKILFVVSSFPPNTGTAILNQITGLIDRGHDVYVYARRKGPLELSHPHMAQYNHSSVPISIYLQKARRKIS